MRLVIVFAGILVLLAVLPCGSAADRPLVDPLLWLRFVAAFAAVVWLPGHLLCGRHLSGHDAMSRLHTACAGGLVALVFGGFLASLFRLPVAVHYYLPTTILVALLVGRLESWRAVFATAARDAEPANRSLQIGIAVVCAAVAVVQLAGGRDFAAPPGPHDAVNHAFLVQRVAETASTRAELIFAEPWGRPMIPYVAGWHAAAALVAQAAGVPPWIAAWYLPLLALALLPLAQAALWRQLRLPPLAIGIGMVLLLGNRQLMLESVKYANFGQFVGMLLAPFVVMLVCRARHCGTMPAGALAGLAVGMLARVHVSWAVFALLFSAVALWSRRDEWSGGARRPALLVGTAVAILVCAVELLPALADYHGRTMAPHPAISLSRGLQRLAVFLGGEPTAICLLVVGVAAGLARRATRPIALLSLALAALTVGLAVYRDPLSLWLSGFVYQQYSRLLVPQIFLLPALAGAALALLQRPLRRAMPARAAATLLLAPVIWATAVGCSQLQLENLADRTLFEADDARLARRIPQHVPEGDFVANWRLDGSPWAMHISGRRFMIPAAWILGWDEGINRQRAIRGLVDEPWSAETRALESQSVRFLWVTDHHLPKDEPPDLRPEVFADDPRFAPVLVGTHSALYEVDWPTESVTQPQVEP